MHQYLNQIHHQHLTNISKVLEPMKTTLILLLLWCCSPELLLSDVHYTSSVDLWFVGSVFAELLFNKPIFTG